MKVMGRNYAGVAQLIDILGMEDDVRCEKWPDPNKNTRPKPRCTFQVHDLLQPANACKTSQDPARRDEGRYS